MDKITKILKVQDMVCINCQNKIEETLVKKDGILKVKASFEKGEVTITYDRDQITIKAVEAELAALGYPLRLGSSTGTVVDGRNQTITILAVLLIGYLALRQFGLLDFINIFPQAEAGMGYGMLFIVGIMTSFHCVGMCGGLNLSQCIGKGENNGIKLSLKPGLLYNFGRVISYTILGGIIGGIGSVITFTGAMRGAVQLFAGVFMIIMALGILNVAPIFKKLTPHLPDSLHKGLNLGGKGPLYIGLLNGFMPCGPLQAMQLYALSTGSPVKGALSMLLFSLGTLPVMFSLSALGGLLSTKLKRGFVQASAFLVLLLGLSMFSQGMALSNFSGGSISAGQNSQSADEKLTIQLEDGVQKVNSTISSRGYQGITVAAGAPVEWTIEVPEGALNGCNYRIFIPEYNIEKVLQTGENIIEFYPDQEGVVNFSCWMGMIRSKITVAAADFTDTPNSDKNNGNSGNIQQTETSGFEEDESWDEDFFFGDSCC